LLAIRPAGIDAGGLGSAGIQFATRLLVLAGIGTIVTSAMKITPELTPVALGY
jgi:hypothetical protein